MSFKAIAKLISEDEEEYEEYLEINQISKGKSLWEVVAGAMAQVFGGLMSMRSSPSLEVHCYQSMWDRAV